MSCGIQIKKVFKQDLVSGFTHYKRNKVTFIVLCHCKK
jgi:hypothetical protein